MTVPTDRAAGNRGGLASDQQAWPEPTQPGARRVPAARRERKPLLAVLAVLLIAVGAVGSYYLVTKNAQQAEVIQVDRLVPVGQHIPAGALSAVTVPANSSVAQQLVPWDEASQVTRFFAATTLEPGTLLMEDMTARTGASTAGKSVVGLSLKDGQVPLGLQVGDRVTLYEATESASGCPPGKPGATIASDALVLAINAPAGAPRDTTTDVQVAVVPTSAANVVCSAANSNIGVAVVASGGQQASGG